MNQAWMLAVVFCGIGAVGALGQVVPAPRMVPDGTWQPRPGDEVTVARDLAPAARSFARFAEMARSAAANDATGLAAMEAAGSMARLRRGVRVLVLAYHAPDLSGSGAPISPDQYAADLQAGAMQSRKRLTMPVEARVLDGPLAGSVVFVAREELERLVPARPDRAPLVVGGRARVISEDTILAPDPVTLSRYYADPERRGPMREAGKVRALSEGTELDILAVKGNDCRVRAGGRTGYVSGLALEPVALDRAKVKVTPRAKAKARH